MLINGVPIALYGAKQLTVEFTQTTHEKTYEWNAGALLPVMVDNRATFKNVTVLMKVTGGSRQEINEKISNIHKLAAGEVQYKLDGYPGWVFVGTLSEEPTVKKTVDRNVYKLTIKVTGYMRSEALEEIEVNRVSSQYVYALGTRDTPVKMAITPSTNLTEFIISGVAERDIVVSNLTAGSTIYIDGLTGLVTENDENKFDDVVMFEFPHLQAGEQLLEFSERTCDITLSYYPMWL